MDPMKKERKEQAYFAKYVSIFNEIADKQVEWSDADLSLTRGQLRQEKGGARSQLHIIQKQSNPAIGVAILCGMLHSVEEADSVNAPYHSANKTLAACGLEEPRNSQELLTESVDLTKFVGP